MTFSGDSARLVIYYGSGVILKIYAIMTVTCCAVSVYFSVIDDSSVIPGTNSVSVI